MISASTNGVYVTTARAAKASEKRAEVSPPETRQSLDARRQVNAEEVGRLAPAQPTWLLVDLLQWMGVFIHSGKPFSWQELMAHVGVRYRIAEDLLWFVFTFHFWRYVDEPKQSA